jgi:multiple sugar transport system permease protein
MSKTAAAAVGSKNLTKTQWTLKEMKRNWVGYVMIAPFILVFILFTVAPVLVSIVISFTDFNLLQVPNFVAFDNYIRLFLDDDIFLLAIKNTFVFAAICGPTSYIMSFMVAWFINELPPKIRAVVTLIFYAPSISGSVYLVWQTLFSSDSYGWANGILLKMGAIAKPILWFEDEK